MKNITKQYQDYIKGKIPESVFVRSARMSFPNFISPITSLKDTINILKGKRLIFESKSDNDSIEDKEKNVLLKENTNSGHTYVNNKVEFPLIDIVDPYQLRRAVEVEVSNMKDITGDAYKVAIDKVLKNLSKDTNYYRDLQIANYSKVSKEDEKLKMKEVGKKNKDAIKTDSAGYLKKQLKKNETSNVSVKKENKRSKPEGVKEMTNKPKKAKGISKTMEIPGKEQVLSELKNHLQKKSNINEDLHYKYTIGQQVNTPEGQGQVTKIVGGTISVQLSNGQKKDYQINVLDKQAREDYFSKQPDLGSSFEKAKKSLTKEQVMQKLKEYFSKKKKKRNEAYVAKTKKGVTVDIGKDMTTGMETAKNIRSKTGVPVTITDLTTGKETNV